MKTGVSSDRSSNTKLPKKRFHLGRVLAFGALGLCAAFLGHFFLFAQSVANTTVPTTAIADGIVVLTGGNARVSKAIELLERGKASRLLISGVHPGTTREQLAAVTSSEMPLKETSVDLDRVALNTEGNATETASWVRKNNFKSLLVVTSAYHLPRAQVELSGVLPDVVLIGYPVYSKDLKLKTWYKQPATIQLLIREYVKYVIAQVRITSKNLSA